MKRATTLAVLGSPRQDVRASDGTRTRDLHLGKVMRYQLRHARLRQARGVALEVELGTHSLLPLPHIQVLIGAAPVPLPLALLMRQPSMSS